ncbi:MAG: hypothetical protein PHY62_11170 [Gallionella sp.]|nr:hypothetical protein [Gallionella sp.]
MRAHHPPIATSHRLAPFVLLSIMLHVAFLYGIPSPTKMLPAVAHPIEVYFSVAAVREVPPLVSATPLENSAKQAKPSTTPARQIGETVSQSDVATTPAFNPQQFVESAKNMARDEARKIEQESAAREKREQSTPVGLLAQYLRQPHSEIRLANGMLKIVTDAGEICFQAVPVFARDMPGLYGNPVTCP